MPISKFIKRENYLRIIPAARIFSWLALLCILANTVPIFGQHSPKSSDLTFCPLQKTWVSKYAPKSEVRESLSDVCAPSSRKVEFFSEASKKIPLLHFIHDAKEVEKLFFNYLKEGKKAFAKISSSHNLPEQELARAARKERTTGGNFKIDFEKNEAEVFVLQQAARPPTAPQQALFEIPAFIKLETISRRIQPRAPPVSIS